HTAATTATLAGTPPSPVLAAGIGLPAPADTPSPSAPNADEPAAPAPATITTDDHSELAWRLRHARRSVLQDADAPVALVADDTPAGESWTSGAPGAFSRPVGSTGRVAANLFAGAMLKGELNFLTTSYFDTPLQLFSG